MPMVTFDTLMRAQQFVECPTDRRIEKEVIVRAPVAAVWRAWTTSDGVVRFMAEGNVELRVDGPYEIFFMADRPYGEKGGDGCRVLSWVPNEMLSFSWNAPPDVPSLRASHAATIVALFFSAVPEGTRMRFVQHGFGEGPDWDAYVAYFERAWDFVLKGLREALEM